MAPFRWPLIANDIALCKEVAGRRPNTPNDYEKIADSLSTLFSTECEKNIELKERGCRERVDRLIQKFIQEDKKALKRSGTEEDYGELSQLLEDISTYKRDMQKMQKKEKDKQKEKERKDKEIGLQMRQAALSGLGKREAESDSSSDEDDDDDGAAAAAVTPKTKKVNRKKRATKLSTIEMLEAKYGRKAELKEREFDQRKLEFEFQKRKYDAEATERRQRLQLEMEEKRAFLDLLKKKM